MTKTLTERVHYGRHKNGADVYLLKTAVDDVVTCMMAFPGGTHAIYNKQSVAVLLGELLPGATKQKKRSKVLEEIEAMGAQVSVRSDTQHLVVTIAARKVVFEKVFKLVLETLTEPAIANAAFHEAQVGVETALRHAQEDTRSQAKTALMRSLYQKGHPHWSSTTRAALRDVKSTTAADVLSYHRHTLSSVGALICVVGDISPSSLMKTLHKQLGRLPNKKTSLVPTLHVDRVVVPVKKDTILTLHDKINVDMLIALPLALTREHGEYEALAVANHALGGSMTSRLFHTLRTQMSLTYGAYSGLAGFNDGYPGYLMAGAIFPHDVFARAQKAMRGVVREFIDKGITSTELKARKEEMGGKYKVGLSTTAGVCGALFATLLARKPVSYIDEYPSRIEGLSLREVNKAIQNHLDYHRAVSASAGAVDEKGKPLS